MSGSGRFYERIRKEQQLNLNLNLEAAGLCTFISTESCCSFSNLNPDLNLEAVGLYTFTSTESCCSFGNNLLDNARLDSVMALPRKIIHCDCDSFYASIEMRDNPDLSKLPIAVGGPPNKRGVVATCNYEARKFGIHSAMASATARKLCPDLIIIHPDMEKYRHASKLIHNVFQNYTKLIEPLSLDEAFLDVSESRQFEGSATRIAEAIRGEVREKVGITISAGIAPNKFLAKIASDWNKPDGQFVIRPEQIEQFVTQLAVKKLNGVGKVTAAKMKRLGIETCGDLKHLSEEKLRDYFGSFGDRLYKLCRGIDNRSVQTERIRKSLSVENTFAEDLPSLDSCLHQLPELELKLSKRLTSLSDNYQIHKQFIKVKFHDFISTTVEMISTTTDSGNYRMLCQEGFIRGNKPVRLLGMGVRLLPAEHKKPVTRTKNQLSLKI